MDDGGKKVRLLSILSKYRIMNDDLRDYDLKLKPEEQTYKKLIELMTRVAKRETTRVDMSRVLEPVDALDPKSQKGKANSFQNQDTGNGGKR